GVCGQASDISGRRQVGRHKSPATAFGFDLLDGLLSARSVAAVHDDVEAITRQLQCDRSADTRGGSGYERDRRLQIGVGLDAHTCSFAGGPGRDTSVNVE